MIGAQFKRFITLSTLIFLPAYASSVLIPLSKHVDNILQQADSCHTVDENADAMPQHASGRFKTYPIAALAGKKKAIPSGIAFGNSANNVSAA